MSDNILEIRGLKVEADGKEILHGVDLSIGAGETHVLMGPNGAGKSTMGNALMGHPQYKITGGSIVFKGQDITKQSAADRAKLGMFYSFQNPIEVPGVSLFSFLRSAAEAVTGERVKFLKFRREMLAKMKVLNMDESYAERDLNVGFSGGEKKKAEILQLLMLQPQFAILDETDSGLDVDAVRTVSAGVQEFYKEGDKSLLIITHSTRILESLNVDKTHVLVNGRLVAEGDASMIDDINENGFEKYEKAAAAE
ncbi:MAG: Fe-S cluster assembly ATPase SufC [Anaerovoracaceae bacterium]|nr:Fe-S cluster assembly ATPase SufC [Bacillota bacterium]MDY2671449.1 Fe-S cluster assembly ATPase SufC [Anaerovoracaceae bacterium]